VPDTLDAQMIKDATALFEAGEKMQLQYNIRNTYRAIGTRLSSHITKKFGMFGLKPGHVTVRLRGSAGQSLGAFAVQGLKLEVFGDANDYVGKGLSGGRVVVRQPAGVDRDPTRNIIVGNTVLYGAIAGEAYFEGVAGERFAVRNSGAVAVVEGTGEDPDRLYASEPVGRIHDHAERRDAGTRDRRSRASCRRCRCRLSAARDGRHSGTRLESHG